MPTPIYSTTDGVLRAAVLQEDGRWYKQLTQLNADAIKARNGELRKNPDALKKLDWASWQLSIPEADYYALRARNPELASPDMMTRRNAWLAFIRSPESLPYRVRG